MARYTTSVYDLWDLYNEFIGKIAINPVIYDYRKIISRYIEEYLEEEITDTFELPDTLATDLLGYYIFKKGVYALAFGGIDPQEIAIIPYVYIIDFLEPPNCTLLSEEYSFITAEKEMECTTEELKKYADLRIKVDPENKKIHIKLYVKLLP